MIKNILGICLALVFFSSVNAYAQEEKDTVIPLNEKKFIYHQKIYKKNADYFTLGVGQSYHPKLSAFENSFNLAYNLRLKSYLITMGYHASSDISVLRRSLQKLNDLHAGFGLSWERLKSNIAFSIGPSYAYGSTLVDPVEKIYRGYSRLGLYAEMQYVYKVFYDVGFGASLYASLNNMSQVVGLQFTVFLSQAYQMKLEN